MTGTMTGTMNLLVVGLNHRTASVTLRERVAFSSEELADALPALRSAVGLRELAILSTCNRTEAIAVGDTLDPDAVIQWISNYHQLPVDELVNTTYIHRGAEAVHHTMTVACGMDSMVLGESQIFGQF
jgi:glutamyl-tRNA reductase